MAAAVWDLIWDVGGGWHAQLSRRDRTGDRIPIVGPVVLEVRRVDESSSAPPRVTVEGVILDEGAAMDLVVTPEQITTVGPGRFEHRIVMGEAPPMIFARGYVTVRDTLGGP